jgi:hypothetical protein
MISCPHGQVFTEHKEEWNKTDSVSSSDYAVVPWILAEVNLDVCKKIDRKSVG